MNGELLQELETVTTTLRQLSYQLAESFYGQNQVYLAQQRIAKLRAGIDREREKIAQLKAVMQRRKEQARNRKCGSVSTSADRT